MPIKISSLFIIIAFILPVSAFSQPTVLANYREAFPFIRHDLNVIDNNYKGLGRFYEQLVLLEKGKKHRVNIVHIGDSHLQADWFSGVVRMELQRTFGIAGRGLVFPYSVAKTNTPEDIYSYSNVQWSRRRNIESSGSIPSGISGFGLRAYTSDFILKLSLGENPYLIDYSFDKIQLFTEPGKDAFDIILSPNPGMSLHFTKGPEQVEESHFHLVERGENLTSIASKYNLSVTELKALNNMSSTTIYAGKKLLVRSGPSRPKTHGNNAAEYVNTRAINSYHSQLTLDERISTLYLKGSKTASEQRQTTLYGMVLENSRQRGILYHMIGVNGARFEHYNLRPNRFLTQVKGLDPDLIILSLGTNETAYRYFDQTEFYKQVDEFVYNLEQFIPNADILITTPPDALLGRRSDNPNVKKAKDILLGYALNNELSCWNFYGVMGGMGSVRTWYSAGLAQSDRLHLTQTGYELQGRLLFDALMNGYGSYKSVKFR